MSTIARRAEIGAVSIDLATDARIAFSRTPMVKDAVEAVSRVLESGWVTMGPEVFAFEQEIGTLVGAPHAVAVASCTAGIELSLRALRLPKGAKVLCPTMTFPGVGHAILNAGFEPVLVDASLETLMPDAETTASATRAAGGVDAMVVLHYAGFPAPVEELAEAAGLPLSRVVEDAAHALGAFDATRPVGAISAATSFSFYATKNLPIGEGGMVTTSDERVADFVRRGRLHGMSNDAWRRYASGASWRYEIAQPGLKANMTDLQAAIGRAQLPAFAGWQARREQIVKRYNEHLGSIPGLVIPATPRRGRHAWHLYVLRVTEGASVTRDGLIAGLFERGVDCSVHFIPLHHQPYFRYVLGPHLHEFPNADSVFEEIVSLPLYPGLTDAEVDRVGESIGSVAGAARVRKGRDS